MSEEASTTKAKDTKAETSAAEEVKKSAPRRKRAKRTVTGGQVHIKATFNNTIISVTDPKGNLLTYSSAGACGFRGSKKGTAYAAQVAADKAINQAKTAFGLSKAEVFVRGIGLGRDASVRALSQANITVESIRDVTGIPHGGVRPRKARRV